jgi:hypothetical protein
MSEAQAMPAILSELPTVEALLPQWRDAIGADYAAYRNHIYRVLHFFRAFTGAELEAQTQAEVAGVFHDLGIWTHGTIDYLEPSAGLAEAWLREQGREAWAAEVLPMVREHHKLSHWGGSSRVEAFRRADWVDVSLGLLKFGLPPAYVREVKQRFPNQGFHKRLLELGMQRMKRHPLSPLPMLKF